MKAKGGICALPSCRGCSLSLRPRDPSLPPRCRPFPFPDILVPPPDLSAVPPDSAIPPPDLSAVLPACLIPSPDRFTVAPAAGLTTPFLPACPPPRLSVMTVSLPRLFTESFPPPGFSPDSSPSPASVPDAPAARTRSPAPASLFPPASGLLVSLFFVPTLTLSFTTRPVSRRKGLYTTNHTVTPATAAAGASQRMFRNQDPFTFMMGMPVSSLCRMSDQASSAGGTGIGLSSGVKNELCLFSPLIVIC